MSSKTSVYCWFECTVYTKTHQVPDCGMSEGTEYNHTTNITMTLQTFTLFVDPEAVAKDAFSQAWRGKAVFAHPPWCLIARTLQKVKLEGATLVLITPLWKAQPWFPLILEMLIDLPLLLPVGKDTLHSSPNCDCPLTTNNQLQLVAWRVSADSSKQEKFWAKQLSLFSRGERKQTLIIGRSGRSGAGTEVSVPFL